MKTDYELSSKWAEKYKIYTRTHLDENKKLLMEDLGNTINVIQLKRISKQLYDIEQELKNAGSDNAEEVMMLMDKFRRKQAIYMKVSEKLGRVIN
jgi:hypothetical protein